MLDHSLAIMLELTRIAGDLREIKMDLRLSDQRTEQIEARMERLHAMIEDMPRKPKIPWADIIRGVTPWLPGITIIGLTLLGMTELATQVATLFKGSPQ